MKSAVFSLRVPQDELECWRWYAKTLKTTVALLVRVAVYEYIFSQKVQEAVKTAKPASDM